MTKINKYLDSAVEVHFAVIVRLYNHDDCLVVMVSLKQRASINTLGGSPCRGNRSNEIPRHWQRAVEGTGLRSVEVCLTHSEEVPLLSRSSHGPLVRPRSNSNRAVGPSLWCRSPPVTTCGALAWWQCHLCLVRRVACVCVCVIIIRNTISSKTSYLSEINIFTTYLGVI